MTDEDTGEQFCGKCGFVITDKVEESGPEWRSFQNNDGSDPARTGAPTSLAIHDGGVIYNHQSSKQRRSRKTTNGFYENHH